MICPVCKCRWAPFPAEDFEVEFPSPPRKGIIPKHKNVMANRQQVFNNNEVKECGCMDNNEYMPSVYQQMSLGCLQNKLEDTSDFPPYFVDVSGNK